MPSSRRPRRLAVVAIVATAAGMATFAAPAGAQDDPAVDPASAPAVGQPGSAADPLVVAVREVQPFTAEREGRWSGFSIDMWEAAADKAGITYEYRRYPDVTAQLAAVTSGEADAALGAISITSEREAVVDFTQPIYDSGIGILATDTEDSDPLRLLASLFTRTLLWLFVMVALLVVVAGHLAWLVERRRNQEHFPRAYGPGVLQGMWWAIVTMTTVGYGDTVARTKAGRLMAAVWMLLSLVVVAQVTAVVTSTLTVERIRGSIDSVADLQGRKVATVRGTTSATYLKGLHISAREAADVDAAVEDLLSGEVDAVVYDEPVLRFQQDTTARGQARLVPVIYQPQGIGMAFTENSPLQEKVSQEFLALRQDGTQETLADRYFGTD